MTKSCLSITANHSKLVSHLSLLHHSGQVVKMSITWRHFMKPYPVHIEFWHNNLLRHCVILTGLLLLLLAKVSLV